MTKASLHLIKLCVGVNDIAHLIELQSRRLRNEGGIVHVTRNTPKRAEELLAGGSIYWVIKKFVRVRQRFIGVERGRDGDGRPYCSLSLDRQLVPTELQEFRAFQGWRYLASKNAPHDLDPLMDKTTMPGDMAAELRGLGLL
ncbi:MAG TPA: DUF1489 family protein [Rhodospirillales bacterium]|nr:DUF1489 family protein [Rhodospirillales bacterium]